MAPIPWSPITDARRKSAHAIELDQPWSAETLDSSGSPRLRAGFAKQRQDCGSSLADVDEEGLRAFKVRPRELAVVVEPDDVVCKLLPGVECACVDEASGAYVACDVRVASIDGECPCQQAVNELLYV